MNMNDDQIREFFHSNRPVTGDEGTYLAGLSAKLEAVESVKRLQEQSIRRYNRITRWTLIGSVALSSTLTAFFIIHPLDIPSLCAPSNLPSASALKAGATTFIRDWKPAVIASIAAISLILGLLPWKKTA